MSSQRLKLIASGQGETASQVPVADGAGGYAWAPQSGGGSSSSTQGATATNLGAAATVNFAATKQQIDLAGTLNSASCVVTYSNRVASCVSVIMVLQDATGGRTLQVSDGVTPQSVYVNPAPGSLSMVLVKCPDATNIEVAPIGAAGAVTTVTATVTLATYTIDLSLGQRFVLTLQNSPALSVGGATTNQQASNGFELILIQDATGGRTVTWFSGIKWAGGTVPTLSSGANKEDDFAFESWDNRATWRGFIEGLDMR